MANENLKIDDNTRWVLGAITNDGNQFIKNVRVNPITGALIVEANVTSTNTMIGSTIPGGTDHSVLFLGLGGTLAQDNANFYYDYTQHFLGLGTTSPAATLDIEGTFKLTDGTQSNGYVLTSDASGNGTWQPAPSATGYNLIQNEGVSVTQRSTINLSNLLTANDSGGKTALTINVTNLASDSTFLSTLNLGDISGQIDLSTQVTGQLDATNIDQSSLDLSMIGGALDLSTQVTGLLDVSNIGVNSLANDATFIADLEPNLDLANLGGQIDLTSQVSGVLPVVNGGTGDSSLTAYAPLFGGTTTTGPVQSGTVGTSGQVLTSNGAGAIATFQNSSSGSTSYINTIVPATATLLHSETQGVKNANVQVIGCDFSQSSPTYMWFAFVDGTGGSNKLIRIYRFEKQTSGNYVYKGITTTISVTSGNGLILGITEMGGNVYIKYESSNPGTPVYSVTQFTTALASPTSITGFSTTSDVYGFFSDPDGITIWEHTTNNTLNSFTISGTTASNTSTITLSANGIATQYIFRAGNGNFYGITPVSVSPQTLLEWDNTGTAQTSISTALFSYISASQIGVGFMNLGGGSGFGNLHQLGTLDIWSIEIQSFDVA